MTTDPLWYELRNSVFFKDFVRADELLAEKPDLVSTCNSIGETVLHFLAVESDVEGVKWLHSRGSSLDAKNRFGTPMVFEVATLAHKDLLRWLWENGTDFLVLDSKHRNILEYLLDRPCRNDVREERDQVVQLLLERFPHLRKM